MCAAESDATTGAVWRVVVVQDSIFAEEPSRVR